MSRYSFHPAVAAWFERTFGAPTRAQAEAWPAIQGGRHTLVAAPTGSGKTLAAFLGAIDALVRDGVAGTPGTGVRVLYVSPLKALSNDIERNLEAPLVGIRAELEARGLGDIDLRAMVRTGDTPQPVRALMRRRPPQILVTTPESLYILLTSESGREMLANVRTVIVDEIHAIAGTKRGLHLALSLERLGALTAMPPVRIGLSATQRPIDGIARFLVGARHLDAAGDADCAIVDAGHVRDRDLALEMPQTPLETVLSAETAKEIYDRIAELIGGHRTTLVFVNTRRLAERVAKALSDRLGEEFVTSHHGSMSRERRLDAERRLKAGELRALVATASLELGIDIGDVDLVCQIGATRTLATLLQRVGRSGHAVGARAKGRIFPQTRDDLVECATLLDMTRRGELDAIEFPANARDVLAQQIVAETACRDWPCDELYALVTQAMPYRDLPRADFDAVLAMLAEGFSFAQGRRSAHLHWDRINGVLRARRGARLVATTCGGAIPDNADYDVIVEPAGHRVGTVNEDFAIESLPGDIFQLGNTSWRIRKVEASAVRVEDAAGEPPNIPFWLGEAPARSRELSAAVSRLRTEFASRLDAAQPRAAIEQWLAGDVGAGRIAAAQIHDYLAAGYRALGAMPTADTLVLERFFDESGGMQLVVHSPLGSRLNKAWGLALRKRFCRQFNFELQAAAVEDAIVISLGAVHSFPLEDVWRYLKADSVADVLTQALLTAPIFTIRWRWVATCALAIARFRSGAKVPARLIRMQAEDLVALVFPDQLACPENLSGPRAVPDHPLVAQTLKDCLHEAMDLAGLEALLREMADGRKRLVCRDLTEPSPFAQAVLNANPYAFLDGAPLEERRTQAVQSRRWLDPATAGDLGTLDAAAIERVREEVWPDPRTREELHEALAIAGALAPGELAGLDAVVLRRWFEELAASGRACTLEAGGALLWIATERLGEARAIWPDAHIAPRSDVAADVDRDAALKSLVRGRMEVAGPVTTAALASRLAIDEPSLELAMLALEQAGIVLRGRFTPGTAETEWCDRRLLARIHRYTLNRLRAEIEAVSAAEFVAFLGEWQHLEGDAQVEGPQATLQILEQLAGFEAAAAAWESAVLPARVRDYGASHLDQLAQSGRMAWLRLNPPDGAGSKSTGPLRSTPVSLMPRTALRTWLAIAGRAESGLALPSAVQAVHAALRASGASFFDDLQDHTGLLPTQIEEALGQLAAAGVVTADSFAGLRVLLTPSARRRPVAGARRRRASAFGIEETGRWSLVVRDGRPPDESDVERVARTLLARYGVVFRRVLERETHLPPWRDVLGVLRRLEARGEVRGGRFVAGFSGEQFALPGAVELLRARKRRAPSNVPLVVNACDPLNLAGILLPGVRVPATAGNRLVYVAGELAALQLGDDLRFCLPLEADAEIRIRTALIGRKLPPALRAYLRR
ncbi:MAG: DEAD/DEAH box helicase [Gammaproteobacteria bacterium]|nr:DEAD/DEAH box helicase [Gammaproteobacteria bacterium]